VLLVARVAPCGKSFRVKCAVAVNQNIANIFAFRRGGEDQTLRKFRRQIFQTVNRQVRDAFEQRDFQLLREQTFRQARIGFGHRSFLQLVAGRLDDLQLELQFRKGGAALRGDQV